MNPELIASVIDGAMMVAGGVAATSVGRKWPWRDVPATDRKHRVARVLRRVGPLIVALGLSRMLVGVVHTAGGNEAAPHWSRRATEDGVCSAEFPGEPKQGVKSVDTGSIHTISLLRNAGEDYYELVFSESDSDPENGVLGLPPDVVLDAVRDGMLSSTGYKLVNESRIVGHVVPGRALELSSPDGKWLLSARVFVFGRRLYRIAVGRPPSRKNGTVQARFLDSLRFEKPSP